MMSINGKMLLALAAASLLSGCVNYVESPTQIEHNLANHYYDRPVKEFFYSYGRPADEYKDAEQGTVYRWTSGQPTYSPSEDYRTYRAPSSVYEVADGTSDAHYCELHIYTNKDSLIERMEVSADSTGKYSASRCQEVLE